MRSRVYRIALAICMLLSIVPSTAKAEPGIVEIADAAGLAAIAEDLSGHYKLTADIELEAAWTPITELAAGRTPVFTGILEGGGHTVSNLYLEEEPEYASLMGNIAEGAEIRNLRVELGTQGVSSPSDAGGLVCYMDGGLIQNCSVSGKVINSIPEDCYAGALVGYMSDGAVSGCYATGSVSGGNAGGLIGYIEGGIVKNSYSLADVSGQDAAGGLASGAENCSIAYCYAAGAVSIVETKGDLGGFLGARYDGGILTSCFYEVEDPATQRPDGIGSDQAIPALDGPEGKTQSALTFGGPLSADWDVDVWYFSIGAYPQMQWAKGQTEEPLAPPAVSDITYGESEEPGRYHIQFPVASEAVAYQIEIFDHSTVQTGPTRLAQQSGEAEPLYTGLFTLDFPGIKSVTVPIGDMLTEAAKADIAIHPQKTVFSYRVSLTAIGSGNAMGPPSERTALPEMQRLTGVDELEPILCERGDDLRKPVSLSGSINGRETQLPIDWVYPNVFPSKADFVGQRTYEAPVVLPLRVLNPDGYLARQTVYAYDTHQPPQALAWDGTSLGTATWSLPDEPGGAVSVCLLDQNQNPVSEEKLVPQQVEQRYDFSEIIRQLGTGNYYFRVKTNASMDGYFRQSEWVTVAEAYPYDGSGSDIPPDPEEPNKETPPSNPEEPNVGTPSTGPEQPNVGTPSTGPEQPHKESPSTGDNSSGGLWMTLLLMASGALMGVWLDVRKKNAKSRPR